MTQADKIVKQEAHTVLGSTRPTQVITCTNRLCKKRFRTQKSATQDRVVTLAKQKGWKINLSHSTAECPECAEKGNNEPRKMSREHKRKIWRTIDDNYASNKYVAPATDKSLAEELGVPWAWVKEVREEDFGPAGEDPELIKMIEKLENLDKRVKELEKAGYRIAEESETLTNEILTVKGQMEAVLKKS